MLSGCFNGSLYVADNRLFLLHFVLWFMIIDGEQEENKIGDINRRKYVFQDSFKQQVDT